MRWTSSIKIDSFGEAINSIKSLDNIWYLSKNAFFLKESGYDAKLNKIVVLRNERLEVYVDEDTGKEFPNVLTFDGEPEYYTLLNYCWSSKFEGCLAYNNVELVDSEPFEIYALPIDAKTLCDSIIDYYKVFFKGISDTNFIAQEIIANLKAIEEAFIIKNDSSEFDNTKKDILLTIGKKVFDIYDSHITLYKSHSLKSIDRKLTVDIYDKLGDKPLATKTNNTKKPLPISSDIIIGFNYVNSYTKPESIKDVFNSLLKADLIDPATKLTDFRKIFCNTAVQKKIVWKGYKNELAFFIKRLQDSGKFLFEKKDAHWQTGVGCFQLSDNKPLINSQLRFAKRPASYMHIITIVSNFI